MGLTPTGKRRLSTAHGLSRRIAEPALERDFDVEVLFDEPLVVVAGAENPWTRRTKIKLAELVNEPWTWPAAGTTFNSLVVQAFRAGGVEAPRPAVHVDAFNMRLKLAATGRFLAIVPASIMKFSGKQTSIKILPVELPTTQSSIGIITLKNRAHRATTSETAGWVTPSSRAALAMLPHCTTEKKTCRSRNRRRRLMRFSETVLAIGIFYRLTTN